jgi:FkbM family methyltransferase
MHTSDHTIVEFKDGARFKTRNFMDVWVLKEAYLDRDYEQYGTTIRDTWTVIDIGAGLGDFAISVALRNPNCQIYAFEPFSESFSLLEENLALNRITNVRPLPHAVGSTAGPMYLDTSTGAPVKYQTVTTPTSTDDLGSKQVQALTLAEVFEELELSHCDFLKVDCEGCEFDVFMKTDRQTIERISHICLEYHDGISGHSHGELVTFFEKHGLSVKVHHNPVHPHLGFLYAHRETD